MARAVEAYENLWPVSIPLEWSETGQSLREKVTELDVIDTAFFEEYERHVWSPVPKLRLVLSYDDVKGAVQDERGDELFTFRFRTPVLARGERNGFRYVYAVARGPREPGEEEPFRVAHLYIDDGIEPVWLVPDLRGPRWNGRQAYAHVWIVPKSGRLPDGRFTISSGFTERQFEELLQWHFRLELSALR